MFKKNKPVNILIGILVAILVMVGLYNVPFINSRLAWRVEEFLADIRDVVSPPEQAVFVPGAETPTLPAATSAPEATPTRAQATETELVGTATPYPTPAGTPIPQSVRLSGITYVDQKNRWNYCGPANLTMALNYWGWQGNRDDVARVVKPGVADPSLDFIQQGRLDLNVMPYEMTDFVLNQTEYSAVLRQGGNLELLKRLVAAGFPVVIEKGYIQRDTTGTVSWMGHYLFVTGYDDSQSAFIVQDAFYNDNESPGKNKLYPYDDFQSTWRSFNFLFFVVYPPDREAEMFGLLGPWLDPAYGLRYSLELNQDFLQTATDADRFFTLFSIGTAYVGLQDYSAAAQAYDQAFAVYATLPQDDKRPYRIMWYQTGPYWAYFYTGRYKDVVNLADVTLATPRVGPTLEESLYWRAMANYALGNYGPAVQDMRESVRLNPNFGAGLARLSEWGALP